MSELYVVVAYDIPDDRRRLRLSKILEGYGERLQYSVFECRITKVQYVRMKERIRKVIREEEDAVAFYFLCEKDVERIERLGGKGPLPQGAIVVGRD